MQTTGVEYNALFLQEHVSLFNLPTLISSISLLEHISHGKESLNAQPQTYTVRCLISWMLIAAKPRLAKEHVTPRSGAIFDYSIQVPAKREHAASFDLLVMRTAFHQVSIHVVFSLMRSSIAQCSLSKLSTE